MCIIGHSMCRIFGKSEFQGFQVIMSSSDTTTSHVRGSALLVVGRLVGIFINFGVQVLTVRYLSKSDYGVFAFAMSVAGILSVISSAGMDKAASRFLAVYLQEGKFSRFWGMLAVMFATVAGVGTVAATIFIACWAFGIPTLSDDPTMQTVLAIITGLAVCTALDTLFLAVFAVLASPKAIFVRRHLLGPLLKLSAALIVIFAGGSVVTFAVGQFFAALIGLGICVSMMRRLISRHPGALEAFWQPFHYPFRRLYRYSVTLMAGDVGFLLRGAMVPVILGILFVGEEVATYQSVVPIARLNEFVLVAFSALFLPTAAKLTSSDSYSELQKLVEQTTLWVSLLSLPLFAASFIASDSLPVLLFGAEYQSSGNILAWLAAGFYVNAAFGTNVRLLRACGRLRTLIFGDLMLMGASVLLIVMLVPRYAALGGAIAVCGTYVSQAVLYQWLTARTTSVNPFSRCCVLPFISAITICLAAKFVARSIGGGLWVELAVAALVSVIVLIAFVRELQLATTFPELARLPLVRHWVPVATKGAKSQ